MNYPIQRSFAHTPKEARSIFIILDAGAAQTVTSTILLLIMTEILYKTDQCLTFEHPIENKLQL